MEKLIGTNLLRGEQYIDAKQVLGVREFLILFYGASWDQKSVQIGEKIATLMTTYNKYEERPSEQAKNRIECLHASNDTSESECMSFLGKQ